MGPQAKCPTCERVLGEQQKKLLTSYTEELTKKNHEAQKLTEDGKKPRDENTIDSRGKNKRCRRKIMYLRSQVVEREKLQITLRHATEEIQREKRELENKKKELKAIGAVEFDEKQYRLIRIRVSEAYRVYQEIIVET